MSIVSDKQNKLISLYTFCFLSLLSGCGVAPGRSRQPGLLSLISSSHFSSVVRSHPDFTSVPCPAIPALAVATIAHTIPCEEMWEEKLRMKRAVPSCLTFNKVPLFTPSLSPSVQFLHGVWVKYVALGIHRLCKLTNSALSFRVLISPSYCRLGFFFLLYYFLLSTFNWYLKTFNLLWVDVGNDEYNIYSSKSQHEGNWSLTYQHQITIMFTVLKYWAAFHSHIFPVVSHRHWNSFIFIRTLCFSSTAVSTVCMRVLPLMSLSVTLRLTFGDARVTTRNTFEQLSRFWQAPGHK